MLPYGRQSIVGGRHRGGRRGAARRLADHRPGGRRASRRRCRAWSGGAECVTVTSGTAALHVAYAGGGRRPRRRGRHHPDDVRRDRRRPRSCSGATVVFADVDRDTGLLDPAAVEAAVTAAHQGDRRGRLRRPPGRLRRARARSRPRPARYCSTTPRTRSASPLPGPPGRLDRRHHHVLVLPDQEPDHGRGRRGRVDRPRRWPRPRAGSATTAWCATRPRSAIPDEGGWHQEVHEFGLNYRLPDVLCALGIAQLRRLDGFNKRRAELVARYNELLADVDGLAPAAAERRTSTRPGTSTRCGSSTAAAARCTTRCAPPASACRSTTSRSTGTRSSRTSATGAACARTRRPSTRQELSLPLFPDLTDDEQDRVVDALRAALALGAPAVHHHNDWYAHVRSARALRRRAGRSGPTPHCGATCSTAGTCTTGSARVRRSRPACPGSCGRRRPRRRGWAVGETGYEVIGVTVGVPAADGDRHRSAAGREREGTIFYPFHGFEKQAVVGDHARLADEIQATETGPITVCLYWLEYRNSDIRQWYENRGFRVITPRLPRRPDPARQRELPA